MTQRIGGQSFDVTVGTEIIHFATISIDITDNTAVTQTNGIPDGWVGGDVGATISAEVDSRNFKKFGAAARAAGSYRGTPTSDVLFYANTGDEEIKVEVFGVKWVVESPVGFDPKGGETAKHKVKGLVTTPDFIRIDGVPILSEADVRDLIG